MQGLRDGSASRPPPAAPSRQRCRAGDSRPATERREEDD